MTDELDLLDDGTDIVYHGEKPAFLKVLCILTFVGAGLGIIWSVVSMIVISAAERLMDNFSNVAQDIQNLDNSLVDAYRWAKWSIYASVVGNLACLTGAIIMWGMRKIGYYIYVVGQGLPLIIGVLSFVSNFSVGGMSGGFFTSFGIVGFVIQAIFPIGFIVMYGLNYKYLR